MNVERNAPCPCGSGKKYKKCCIETGKYEVPKSTFEEFKEDAFEASFTRSEDEWEPDDFDFFNNLFTNDDDDYPDEDSEDDDYPDEDSEDDDYPDEDSEDDDYPDEDTDSGVDDIHTIFRAEELPKLSEEDNKLVENWWKDFKRLRDTVKEREHLIRFMDAYPHLVVQLHLHWEVLFEIGIEHFIKGIYETFVELLLRVRKEFPDSYKKSFGYYDADLIYWYAAQGRIDEIKPFFDWFKQDKKAEYNDKIDSIICFLRAINRSDILLTELESNPNTKKCVIKTRFHHILSRYIEKPVTEESVGLLMNELVSNNIPENKTGDVEFLGRRLQSFTRPFTVWDDTTPIKRSIIMDTYLDITDNFSSYLHKIKGLSFDSAIFYSNTIYEFFEIAISNSKRPKNIFSFDKQSFEDNLLISNWTYLDFHVEQLAQLNAFYYFAAYLKLCGNMTEEQKQELQTFITKIFRKYYAEVKKSGPEMLSFKQFPLWGID